MKELHKFPGGLLLDGFKQLTCDLETLPPIIPERLIFPLSQHIGTRSTPVVKIGDQVLKGQLIASPGSYVSSAIHASSSGVVEEIGKCCSLADGSTDEGIVIKTDGQDLRGEKMTPLDFNNVSAEQLEQRITEAGIIGMGGAGFPSHVKVIEGADESVETLVINGVECEPYISCDDRLIRERTQEIIMGAEILQKIVGARECLLAVEDDMPEAYEALLDAVSGKQAAEDQIVIKVPAIYPAGGENQLIKTLTGKRVTSRELPIQTGVLVQNVATVAAIFRAVVKGEPLISRIVTVAGTSLARSQNIEILNGTPVGELLRHFQDEVQEGFGDDQEIIFGGTMMGTVIESDQVPILKKTSSVLVLPQHSPKEEVTCIRCGDCVDVCPELLQPQMLVSLAKKSDLESLRDYRLFDCIECACCDQVCPSHIPLVKYFQKAKVAISDQGEAKQRAEKSKSRYLSHNVRLEQAKVLKNLEKTKFSGASDSENLQSEVRAAIQRTKAKRKKLSQTQDESGQ